jgi:hypothetical protein
MKLGTETGSLVNHAMASSPEVEPQVGMGATMLMWTDRNAGTVVRVTPKTVYVQRDRATRTDSNGMSEHQEYAYEPDPAGAITVFRRTKRGWRSSSGEYLRIGRRETYRDFSF